MNTQSNETCPQVSVVIPAFNAGAYIDETLNALEKQTLCDIEIICVDDGSADDTLVIAEKHADSDARVKVLHQSNSGAGVARNAGLALAAGKWIAFLDADDIYRPDFLEKMVSAAETYNAEVAVCECDSLMIDGESSKPWFRIPIVAGEHVVETADSSQLLFQLGSHVPFNKLFRLSFIRESGLKFQALSSCNDLFFTCSAIAGAKRVALVREALVSYRICEGSSIQDDLLKHPTMDKCKNVYRALTALREFCLSNNLLNEGSLKSLEIEMITGSFAATTKALGHDELLRDTFAFYQTALICEWQVSAPSKSAGIEVWSKYQLMVNSTASQLSWIYKEAGQSRRGGKARKALIGAKTALVIARNKIRRK